MDLTKERLSSFKVIAYLITSKRCIDLDTKSCYIDSKVVNRRQQSVKHDLLAFSNPFYNLYLDKSRINQLEQLKGIFMLRFMSVVNIASHTLKIARLL